MSKDLEELMTAYYKALGEAAAAYERFEAWNETDGKVLWEELASEQCRTELVKDKAWEAYWIQGGRR